MISTNEKIAKKQRKILGPLGRLLLKVFRWEINGKIEEGVKSLEELKILSNYNAPLN